MSSLPNASFEAEPENHVGDNKARVIIAGAGIGGLTLAMLLHKANVPFVVLERAQEIKPLGSALLLGTGIGPLFRQLGIYDDFIKVGKHTTELKLFNDKLEPEFVIEGAWLEQLTHYRDYVVSRPDLHDFLWKQVPREHIHLGKKIISYDEDGRSVVARCADGTKYYGHILVGADGAYSAVRQHLFKILKGHNALPASDEAPLSYGCVCLVGQTEVLDAAEFPELNSQTSQFNSVLGTENMCTWLTFSTKKNSMCWMVIKFLDQDSSKDDEAFSTAEWGAEAVEAMCKEVRPFKVPGGKDGKGLTIGDYIDRTPKDSIGKVMLEEKVFEAWSGGRTVLLGDACHKMNPAGGVGGLVAMHDAVALANWISTIQTPAVSYLEKIFNEYRDERYPVAKEAFESSQLYTKFLGKSVLSVVVRAVMKRFPDWLWRRLKISMNRSRPQVSFLPLVEDKGSVELLYQPSLHKTLAIHKEQTLAQEQGAPRAIASV
ncbi:hypothetical protein CPB97_005906 [Podila verticillata]|nr:hypothetical protein CPB97_005906 [Podila verticillata]